METESHHDWKHHGVRIVRANELDMNTPQTPGMTRAAAITHARTGAEKLWAGTVTIHPDAKTGAHHHGALESVIYVVRGRARMRWGDRLEFVAEAGPGDFIYVPPYVPHQEINAGRTSRWNACSCAAARSRGGEPRHSGRRGAGGGVLGRSHSPGPAGGTGGLGTRHCRLSTGNQASWLAHCGSSSSPAARSSSPQPSANSEQLRAASS